MIKKIKSQKHIKLINKYEIILNKKNDTTNKMNNM